MTEAPRLETIPDCDHRQRGELRIYRTPSADRLEALYEDGWGNPFWAPLPVVEAPGVISALTADYRPHGLYGGA